MNYQEYVNYYKSEREKDAIAVASQMFFKDGIKNVKMTDIAIACDTGVATLYRYFGTKKKFVVDVAIYTCNELEKTFIDYFQTEIFTKKTGIKQVEYFFNIFNIFYEAYPSFIKFLYDFDNYVVSEKITTEELEEYESIFEKYYTVFEEALKKGIRDKTIKEKINFKVFYMTVTHSLMNLCEKLICTNIFISDNHPNKSEELSTLINMAINYIKK